MTAITLAEDPSRAARLFIMDPAKWSHATRRSRRAPTRDRVLAAYDPALTITEIAERAGARYGATQLYLRKATLPTAPGYHSRSDKGEIIAAARRGPNLSAVAAIMQNTRCVASIRHVPAVAAE